MFRRIGVGVLALAVLPWAGAAVGGDYVQGREAAIKLYWADKRDEALTQFVQLAESSITELQKADALDWASTAALRLKRPDEARGYAEQIPLVPMRKVAIARILLAESRWQEVLDLFEHEDLSRWPPSVAAAAYDSRGRAHWRLENAGAAAADFAQAAEWAKAHDVLTNSLLGLARAHQALQDPEAAVRAYQRVYEATDNVARHADAAMAVADIRLSQGRSDDAVAELAKVDPTRLRVASLQVDLLMIKGRALAQQGQEAEAITSYRDAMAHREVSDVQKAACQAAITELGGESN